VVSATDLAVSLVFYMPKPVLTLKKEQEASAQEQKELVLPAEVVSTATPSAPPQQHALQPNTQPKYDVLLELIGTLTEEQIQKFFTPEGIKEIIYHLAQQGNAIAKLAKVYCSASRSTASQT